MRHKLLSRIFLGCDCNFTTAAGLLNRPQVCWLLLRHQLSKQNRKMSVTVGLCCSLLLLCFALTFMKEPQKFTLI